MDGGCVHHLDCGDGFMGAYTWQHLLYTINTECQLYLKGDLNSLQRVTASKGENLAQNEILYSCSRLDFLKNLVNSISYFIFLKILFTY